MAAPRIFIGAEFFREIRENGFYYADKSGIIEELLVQNPAKVTLLTRPRRFGKTLTMTMLQEFFDIRKDSRGIFEELAVSENSELCEKWMNKYPAVFLTLKGVEGLSFEQAMGQMKELIGRLCREFSFLLESPSVDETDRQTLRKLKNREGTAEQLTSALSTFCTALHDHYGKNVILLIDEYDVPLAKAQENGYYKEMVAFIRAFLGGTLKTSPFLQLAVLTGCLRISKESIFTGLNNFRCYGIDDALFADKVGFTSEEVDALLESAGLAEKKAVLREWYDGYRFGNNVEMYCPWDVLQYVADVMYYPSSEPKAYWNNSSGNGVIKSFVGRSDLSIGGKFETLLAGGCVEARITENLTYDSLHSSEDNLWTLLYLTGYLTKARPEQMEECGILPGGEMTPLVIPNKEIR
ncbi:MAG: AAA family ATPase, partial [Mailhella sp.]